MVGFKLCYLLLNIVLDRSLRCSTMPEIHILLQSFLSQSTYSLVRSVPIVKSSPFTVSNHQRHKKSVAPTEYKREWRVALRAKTVRVSSSPLPLSSGASDAEPTDAGLEGSRGKVKVVVGATPTTVDNGNGNGTSWASDLDGLTAEVLGVEERGRNGGDEGGFTVCLSASSEARGKVGHFASSVGDGLGVPGSREGKGNSNDYGSELVVEHHCYVKAGEWLVSNMSRKRMRERRRC